MYASFLRLLGRIAPGLHDLRHYHFADLPKDLAAGLAVAAVALPVGVAYAQLAGFHPAAGLYSSILPLLAYFLFGTSRQLIIGPDAATCALIALTVTPMAGGDPQAYIALSALLALFAGLFCILACVLKLGALADFLSRPILVGFLNGVAISIAFGQFGKLLGFTLQPQGIIPELSEFQQKIGQLHWPTLIISVLAFALLRWAPRLAKRLPASLLTMLVTGLVVAVFNLEAFGVRTLGVVPAGLPALGLPDGAWHLLGEHLKPLLIAAAGIAFISFTSAMLTARSFAAKNRYDIDVDREFAALGAANIASALSQGFAISGADSRTAISDTAGGRTRLTGLFAASAVALVLLFLTGPLQFVPIAALGAVLVMAALALLDLASLRRFWQLDRREFLLSLLATFGVIWVGALQAILVVVLLAILRFVQLTARPRAEVLGTIAATPGFHALDRHADATVTPGLMLFRFNGPLVFFNAGYFKREALAAVNQQGADLRWFVLDMIPLTQLDITGIDALMDLQVELASRGVELVAAGRRSENALGITLQQRYPTLRKAQQAYRKTHLRAVEPAQPNEPPMAYDRL